MSLELFYTSAPKGLRPGSSGFCTVAATRGMPAALVERLEGLSGYRHLYPPLDAKADLNPVCHSHLVLTVQGKVYHVLSRIAPAGLDYSQRGNKLAHHLVLEAGELPPGGPAWLLSQPGFMDGEWDGQVRQLPAGRRVPMGDAPPAPCAAWQRVTGDAGWAGVLAEAFERDANRPVYLVYLPGQEMLPLVAEALALLPVERRWEMTFSTYFTGLPHGLWCTWRFVPKGAAETSEAARVGATVLDLTAPLARPRQSALVEQARQGRPLRRVATMQSSPQPWVVGGEADGAAAGHRQPRPNPLSAQQRLAANPRGNRQAPTEEPHLPPTPPPPSAAGVDVALAGVTLAASADLTGKQKRGRGPAFLLGALVGACVVGGLGGLLWLGGKVRLNLLDKELEERSTEARSLQEREADLRRQLAAQDKAIAERRQKGGDLQKEIQQQQRQVARGKDAVEIEQAVAAVVKTFSDEWTGERRKEQQEAAKVRAELGKANKKLGEWGTVLRALKAMDPDLSRPVEQFIRDPGRRQQLEQQLGRWLRFRVNAEVAAGEARSVLAPKLRRLAPGTSAGQRVSLLAEVRKFIDNHGDTLVAREFRGDAGLASVIRTELCKKVVGYEGKQYDMARADAERVETWLAQARR
jgi:hypothetical protein